MFDAGFTLVELLAVVAIMGLLIALCLPALHIGRESMRRAACGNKLRQIGLATMNFYEANGHFPFAKQASRRLLAPSQFSVLPDHLIGVGSAGDGFPPRLEQVGSWLLRIQPFMEQPTAAAMWSRAATVEQVHAMHPQVSGLVISDYVCPSDNLANAGRNAWNYGMNSYVAVSGNDEQVDDDGHASNATNGVFPTQSWTWSPRPKVTIARIAAGLSHVTLVGERPPSANRSFGRWNMTDFDTVMANPNMEFSVIATDDAGNPCPSPGYFRAADPRDACAATHFWSMHPGGGSWLLGSGAVVFLDYSAGTTVLPDMASIHGPAFGGQVSATAAP